MIECVVNKGRAAEILLLEDNYGDVILARKAFSGRMPVNITVAGSGEEAMSMLRREGKNAAVARPDLIMLDINLPRRNGMEVLQEIKADTALRTIPVIVLTSSLAERDVVRSYDLHANAYLIKPITIERFSQMAEAVEDFWFSAAVFPDPQDIERVREA